MNTPSARMVLLVAEDAAAWQFLEEAEQILAAFEVPTRRVEGKSVADAAGPLADTQVALCAVIVASADASLPEAWAQASKRPTLRVPVGGGEGQSPLELLRDQAGELPAGSIGGEFATMAIGAAGAKNAALFVVSTLALSNAPLRDKWLAFRARQTAAVLEGPALRLED